MLQEKGKELRLVEFLAILAALLGIVYWVFPTQPPNLGNFPLNSLFAAYLIFFMMYSALAMQACSGAVQTHRTSPMVL